MKKYIYARKFLFITTLLSIAGCAATVQQCPPRGICKVNEYQYNYNNKTYCLKCP